MRLLLNENIPIASVRKLQSLGYDLVAVGEKMSGATDQTVLEFAHQTQRIVVTFDRDYGELIYHQGLPARRCHLIAFFARHTGRTGRISSSSFTTT